MWQQQKEHCAHYLPEMILWETDLHGLKAEKVSAEIQREFLGDCQCDRRSTSEYPCFRIFPARRLSMEACSELSEGCQTMKGSVDEEMKRLQNGQRSPWSDKLHTSSSCREYKIHRLWLVSASDLCHSPGQNMNILCKAECFIQNRMSLCVSVRAQLKYLLYPTCCQKRPNQMWTLVASNTCVLVIRGSVKRGQQIYLSCIEQCMSRTLFCLCGAHPTTVDGPRA